jgi:hypothetical protein
MCPERSDTHESSYFKDESEEDRLANVAHILMGPLPEPPHLACHQVSKVRV